MFLDVEGRVWGCGHNNNASLALPHTNCVTSVEVWQENAKFAHISAGFHRSLLIDEEGGVWYAGMKVEESEQLEQIYNPHIFNKVQEICNCAFVSSCASHQLVVGTEGQLWVWGSNKSGQLGLGNKNSECLPVLNELLPSIRIFHRTKSARNACNI